MLLMRGSTPFVTAYLSSCIIPGTFPAAGPVIVREEYVADRFVREGSDFGHSVVVHAFELAIH